MRELGVWRSWLAHLVWDQRVLCSSHSTPTFNKNLLKISRFFLFTRRGLGYKKGIMDHREKYVSKHIS